MRAYVDLLRYAPAARPFLAALIARLPMSMAPLGILILVQHERGAYALAGLVTGAYAVGSACGTPLWGRLMDRFGQVRVLAPTALASGTFLAAIALGTVLGGSNLLLVGLAVAAGCFYPPISPALRVAWRIIYPDPAARRVAFALDATSIELIFVGGPLLLSALLAATPPVAPLLATAALMIIGSLGYCRTEAARRSRPVLAPDPGETVLEPRRRPIRSAMSATGVTAVLFVMLALSIGFGQLDTSMAATAGALLGDNTRVGILFAAIAGGSTIGGLAFGARHWRLEERKAVPVLLGLFAVLLTAMAVLLGSGQASLWLVLPLLFLTGSTIAPTLIMQQALLDHLAPLERLNEAQAFLSAANTTGAAAGTAIAGFMIDFYGLGWSFAGAAIFAGVAALIAAAQKRRWLTATAAVSAAAEVRPAST
jgi:MFS family permease